MKIGLIDSGMGGFSVLKTLIQQEVKAEYFYIYDNKYHPYGQKTQNELTAIGYQNMKILLNQGADIVVIACNTLTSGCVDKLRTMFKIPIIGVEPPIKPCAEQCQNILILATPFTISSERFSHLMHEFTERNFYYPHLGELASLIEKQIEDEKTLDEYLRKKLIQYNDIDGVVIGCTHYNFIEDKIRKMFVNSVVFSNTVGVANRVKSIIKDNSFRQNNYSVVKVFITGDDLSVEKRYFLCKYIDFAIEFLNNI